MDCIWSTCNKAASRLNEQHIDLRLFTNMFRNVIKYGCEVGQWWWSSGQRARLLLRRSEFEFTEILILYIVCKERKLTKEAEVGQFLFF